jgi:hypothetical protein
MNGDAASEVGVVGQEGAEAAGVHVAEDLLVIELVEATTTRARAAQSSS